MDLKDESNKVELDRRIEELTEDYRNMLLQLSNNHGTYKRAALLYYWLRDYKNYIRNEHTFAPQYYPAFERGNIINVNLGFNLGSETGGLHYALVICNSNRHNPVLNIIPLSSMKANKTPDDLRPTEVYLGKELYYQVQGKFQALRVSIPKEIKVLEKMLESKDANDIGHVRQRIGELSKKVGQMKQAHHKLQVLKEGSVAVMNQIRTISKMRVSEPRDSYDILYGIKLSAAGMDQVDKKTTEMFTKVKNN